MLKTSAFTVVLLVVASSLMASGPTSSHAAVQERVLENGIRDHVPIKINIKKEKEASFKDLKNEKWASEFELEVTNTGDKPIYFLLIHLDTDSTYYGTGLVFVLHYGRPELGDLVTKALPDDPSIKPNETCTLTLGEGPANAWEMSVAKGNHADATKLRVLMQGMSFGDGTGYFANTLYPPPKPPGSF